MPLFNLYKEDLQRVKKPTDLWSKEANTIDHSVSTLFGPYGMYKMTESGEILISGKDVLDNIDLGPMAEPIIKSVNAQYEEHRDGTTSLALLLSRLIANTHDLKTSGLSIPVILSGYKRAMEIAIEETKKLVKKIDKNDFQALEEIIKHSLAGTIADKENIIQTIRDAILFLKEPSEDDITVFAEEGGEGTEVILGVKLDYNRVRDDMPDKLENVNIALVDKLTPRKTSFDIKMHITSAERYSVISKMEEEQLRREVDKLVKLGVKAVFAKGEIDPRAAEMLARAGIAGFEKVNESDMKSLVKTTGARIVSISTLSKDDLGYAGTLDDSDEEGCVGGVCRT
ncbi:MAG: hypothetical protein J7K13_04765 [Thermoplasmata archaeon]|nr:hypothetical protein [Thermoplasmata archaeon]